MAMIDTHNPWMILLAIAVVMTIGAFAVALTRRAHHARTARLREQFGPEYDRAVDAHGTREGELVLDRRVRRVDRISFRTLSDAERVRFAASWNNIQLQFVDDPRTAVARANELIKDVMRALGYSADANFEQRVEDLSVGHPDVVQHYRAAHALAQRGAGEESDTEDLRQAVVHFRALFADLLQPARAMTGVLRPAHA